VARAGLGTLNHAALTVGAIRDRRFAVHGIVIGSWPAEPGPAERYNRHDLTVYAGVPVLGAIPQGASALPPAQFQAQAPSWIEIDL
jgi:dethiobiotin synthetase